jgi:Uma2 family endonuclease
VPTTELLESPVRPKVWATEADALEALDGDDKRLVELIDGELVEKPMGFREGFLASWLATCLTNFAMSRKLGIVAGADGLVRVAPNQLRLPDIAYYPWTTPGFPAAVTSSIGPTAPALAVEVLSDSNTVAEMDRKRIDFFAAGTRLFWIVDAVERTVAVYTSPTEFVLLTGTGILDGGAVLPGFALALPELFGYLDPPAQA